MKAHDLGAPWAKTGTYLLLIDTVDVSYVQRCHQRGLMASKNCLGLDIGASSIKLIQLKQDRKGVHLVAFDMTVLPEESVVDGVLMNFGVVVETIKEMVKKGKIRNKEVAFSLSGNSVIIKKINLPEMTPEELEDSIQWEAEQYIPFDINDVNVDVQILNPQAGQGQMDVLLVAAKKDVIDDYMSVIREAGLKPVVADVDTFAIQNAFELNYGYPPNETICLVNVGASVININVIMDGITIFTRDIALGGALLTTEIQRHLNVSFEEAEHYKTLGEGNITNNTIAKEVERLAKKISHTLVTEMQRSLDFFAATTVNADISRLYLCGGAAYTPTLLKSMETGLAVPVEIVNPFKNVMIDSKRFDVNLLQTVAPVATVATGLGLRRRVEKR
jgi:type IV pilus assembly protein PilM